MKLVVLACPRLEEANWKIAEKLMEYNYEVVFLPYTEVFEYFIKEYIEGTPYEELLNTLIKAGLVKNVEKWERKTKPILEALIRVKKLKKELKIRCYIDANYASFFREEEKRILDLTFRGCLTGNVEVEIWKKILWKIVNHMIREMECEAETIIRDLKRFKRGICISGLTEIPILVRKLRDFGVKVKTRFIFTPYRFTPIEELKNLMLSCFLKNVDVSNSRVEKLVRMHLSFIKDFVLKCESLDDAYYMWVKSAKLI